MKYKNLNRTDLSVSALCLGTVNYGTSMTVNESKRQLSQFVEMGGNFVDTAHIYGDWEPGLTARSERAIGKWIQETGQREKIVLATKGAHPDWGKMEIPRVWPKDIEKDLHESLEFLNTDYIDIYFLHRDDPNVPVSQIIDYLDAAVEAGKIRYYGCSNWKLERVKEAAAYAKSKGSKGFVVNQLMWSLADINFPNLPDKTFVLMDKATYDYSRETGMNVMAYMSIAKAFFTRKFAGEQLPPEVSGVYENNSNSDIYEEALEVVKKGKYSFMDLALLYLVAEQSFPSIPIASFDNEAQLVSGLSCLEKDMPTDILMKLGSLKQFIY